MKSLRPLLYGAGLALCLAIPSDSTYVRTPNDKDKITAETTNTSALDAWIAQGETFLGNLEDIIENEEGKRSDEFAWRERFLAKYGTPENPTVHLRDGFTVTPIRYDRIKSPRRSPKDFEEMSDLYKTATLLLEDISTWEQHEGTNIALPDIQHWLKGAAKQEKTYVINHDGRTINIESPEQFVAFLMRAGAIEVKSMYDATEHFTAKNRSRGISVWNNMQFYAAVNQLRKHHPEMLGTEKVFYSPHDMTKTGGKRVRAIIDPTLDRMLVNAHERPDIIIHPSREIFKRMEKRGRHSGGVHDVLDDRIATFPQPNYFLIGTLLHELGHGISMTDEIDILDRLEKSEMYIGILKEVAKKERRLLERAYEARETQGEALEIFERACQEGEQEIKEFMETVNLPEFLAMPSLHEALTGNAAAQLEETSAYLFEDLALHDIARRDPSLGIPLLQIRDFRFAQGLGREHYGSFKLGRELLKRDKKDPMQAFAKVAWLTDSEERKRYKEVIDLFNSAEGIVQEGMDDIDRVADEVYVRRSIQERTEREINQERRRRKLEWAQASDDPGVLTDIHTRMQEEQARLVELYESHVLPQLPSSVQLARLAKSIKWEHKRKK